MNPLAMTFVAACGAAGVDDDAGFPGPRELGRVHWSRDLEAALSRARAAAKPVFALFQEVPG